MKYEYLSPEIQERLHREPIVTKTVYEYNGEYHESLVQAEIERLNDFVLYGDWADLITAESDSLPNSTSNYIDLIESFEKEIERLINIRMAAYREDL